MATMRERTYFTYIVASRSHTLHIGVTHGDRPAHVGGAGSPTENPD
jgi:hypothetical protein